MTATGHVALPFGEPARTADEAFAVCERLARSHYENFSVATRLLPGHLQRHFFSIYAFCRGVDDLGDEIDGDRPALLDAWEAELDAAYNGTPAHPYFAALQQTIREFDIPRQPFLKLIEANRRDQVITRHPNFSELLDYCEYSANPVGSLVLYLFSYRDPELHRLSDNTCTALQLTNFWQDVARDYDMGRIYIPQDTMERFGVLEDDIAMGRATPGFKAALRFEVERARELFRKGIPLIDRVQGKAKVDIALFTAGGMAILDKIEERDFDVLSSRPVLSRREKAVLFGKALLRSRVGMHPLPGGRGR